jgi:hypothetical protein
VHIVAIAISIALLWWYGTWQRFRHLQRELMPGSPRPRRLRKFQVIGFVLLASGMLLLLATVSFDAAGATSTEAARRRHVERPGSREAEIDRSRLQREICLLMPQAILVPNY